MNTGSHETSLPLLFALKVQSSDSILLFYFHLNLVNSKNHIEYMDNIRYTVVVKDMLETSQYSLL